MTGPIISLCTYTYNDAEFVTELIHSVSTFTIQPDEIIVVDDGSDTPFSMLNPPSNLRVIRLRQNHGIAGAKDVGLTAANGEYILSIDADVRLAPDWLERTLLHIDVPRIGMVSGIVNHDPDGSLVSRYLSVFENRGEMIQGSVSHIPGNVFLIRRDSLEQVGGLFDLSRWQEEDRVLCNRLHSLGYNLYVDGTAGATMVRPVSRTAMCRQRWASQQDILRGEALNSVNLSEFLHTTFVVPMLDRGDESAVLDEPLFYYLDLLYLAHAVLDILSEMMEQKRISRQLYAGFVFELLELFGGYPKIQAMFRADIYAMGHDVIAVLPQVETAAWKHFFSFASMMRRSGLFSWFEEEGVAELVRDELESDTPRLVRDNLDQLLELAS